MSRRVLAGVRRSQFLVKRTGRWLRPALLLTSILIGLLALSSAGYSQDAWPDLTPSILEDYGVAEDQVAGISQGYLDGLWRPYAEMKRSHFVKMAVEAFELELVDPGTPSFVDVPRSHDYYRYVEAATGAGLVNGVSEDRFGPDLIVTREQAAAIVTRWLAHNQLGIDLIALSEEELNAYLPRSIDSVIASFQDGTVVSDPLREEVGLAAFCEILRGTERGELKPRQALLRIPGAAVLIRSQTCDLTAFWDPVTSTTLPPGSTTTTTLLTTKDVVVSPSDAAFNPVGEAHQLSVSVPPAAVGQVTIRWELFDSQVPPGLVGSGSADPSMLTDGVIVFTLPAQPEGHYTIVISVYDPAGSALASVEVEKDWYLPVVTDFTLEPSFPRDEPLVKCPSLSPSQTYTVTVFDQHGNPVAGDTGSASAFTNVFEGDVTVGWPGKWPATDSNGKTRLDLANTNAGWGLARPSVWRGPSFPYSKSSYIYWAFDETLAGTNFISWDLGADTVRLAPGARVGSDYYPETFNVYVNDVDSTPEGSGVYTTGMGSATVSLGVDLTGGDVVFIEWEDNDYRDEIPNYWCEQTS